MELENKEDFHIDVIYSGPKDNVSLEELERIESAEKINNEFFNNLVKLITHSYKIAENYEQFENSFFQIWYNIKDRNSLFPLIDEIFNFYKIIIPKYYILDKSLYEKSKIKDEESNRKGDEISDGEKFLKETIDFGESRIEVYANKPKNVKEQLEGELNRKKEGEKTLQIYSKAEEILFTSKSYAEYKNRLKPIYYELYDLDNNYRSFEFLRGQITYGLPQKRSEWKNEIPKVTAMVLRTVQSFSKEEADSFKREDELASFYDNQKYIVRYLIFNDGYSIEERELFIEKFIKLFKTDEKLFDFVSNSVEKQIVAFSKKRDELMKVIKIYREERLSVYEELQQEIKNSSLFKSLSEKQKQDLQKIYDRLSEIDLRFIFYYKDYQNIKAEIDRKMYNEIERDRANKLGIDDFKGWKYAFYVLSFRNENNSHFLSCFKDSTNKSIDINDKDNLEEFFINFHGAYNTHIHRKSKRI